MSHPLLSQQPSRTPTVITPVPSVPVDDETVESLLAAEQEAFAQAAPAMQEYEAQVEATLPPPEPVTAPVISSDELSRRYQKIWNDGKLVVIHVGMWGMSHQLDGKDLAIEKNLPEIIRLGKKMLIKPEVFNKFKNVEQRARNFLYSNSFSFPLVPQAHFVPNLKHAQVRQKLLEFKNEFESLTQQFIGYYEGYKAETLAAFPEYAHILEPHYPSLEEIQQKFRFEIMSFEAVFPKELGEFDLNTEMARTEAADQARTEEATKAQAEYQEQLNTHMSKLDEFLHEANTSIRSKVLQHCEAVAEKIRNKELISKTNIKTLLRQVQDFRELNFLDDQAVATRLNSLEVLLQSGADFKANEDALAQLGATLDGVISETKNLSDVANVTGEYFRTLDID